MNHLRSKFLLFLFLPLLSVAQEKIPNMVLNPSFEEYKDCPQDYTFMDKTHRLIPHWTYPSFTTPDYFNQCSKGQARVPDNFAGYSEPKSGKGYMGAILTGTDKNFREYVQGELSGPMESGQRYCVSFWYKLASGSKFAVDQLSVKFVDTQVANDNGSYLDYKPDLTNTVGLFLDNTDEWELFCQIYTAKGGEQFFLVGNFNNYENTNYVVTGKDTKNKRGKSYAYYFYDDFAIRPLIDCSVCACVPQGMEAVVIDSSYTGGLDPITGQIEKIQNDGIISLGISGGAPPYSIEWSNGKKNVQKLTNLAAGEYSYLVRDKNNCRAKGTIKFVEPKVPEDPFKEGLRNIEEGAALILNNIFFETGKSTLLPTSYPELDKVAEFLGEGTVSMIEISGHTDNTGSDEVNQKLSQQRAQAVVDYFVQNKKITTVVFRAKGYGPTRPLDTNSSEIGKAKNRRVEFLVLKK